jgi:hypothetical protein
MRSSTVPVLLALACSPAAFPQAQPGPTPKLPPPANITVNFQQHVQPILEAKCYGCHGGKQQQSGLRLDMRQAALRGGDYGVVIVPGNSAQSKLILRLIGADSGLQMPPTGPLAPEEIGILRGLD